MDMALARPGQTGIGMVHLDYRLLVYHLVTKPSFGGNFAPIAISRGTGAYHGIMALILFVGYAILCIHNIRTTDETRKINILWILAIGILVQFAWEFVLLVTGIRNPSFMTIVVNSLLETNLGLPYMYFIHQAVSKRYHENLSRREKIIVA